MKIDRHLNLVFPLEREEGVVYVHCSPLPRAVFERYFLVISKAYALIYQQGINIVAGPRVAAMILKKVAEDMGLWEGEEGVEKGLVAEIRRLANVFLPTPEGWQMVPLQSAISREMLDPEDIEEAEGVITFFIAASALNLRRHVKTILMTAGEYWDFQITSSNSTEFRASLPTSMPEESSGETAIPSSIPY